MRQAVSTLCGSWCGSAGPVSRRRVRNARFMPGDVTTGNSLREIPIGVSRGFPVRPKPHSFAIRSGVRSPVEDGFRVDEPIAATFEINDRRGVLLRERPYRATGSFVCMGCGKRGNPGAFGVFVNCTDCGSDQIMDADILDRFGPKDTEAIRREKNEKESEPTNR